MSKKLTQLQDITRQILASQDTEQEIEATKLLNLFYLELVPNGKHHSDQLAEAKLAGGLALSPHHAAMCIEDYIRTARFIKGVHSACLDLMARFPSEKINVLYAGCGPYGTIFLPVLSLFDPSLFTTTFLDYSPYSIDELNKLIDNIGFSAYDTSSQVADAITYVYPKEKKLHLLITETMFQGLLREPQVAVTANLAPQVVSNGILIPEEIEIYLCRAKYAQVPFIQVDMSYRNGISQQPLNLGLGHVMTVSLAENHAETWKTGIAEILSPIFDLEENSPEFPDFYLQTTVKVYKEQQISPSESLITNAYCVGNHTVLKESMRFQLKYNFKNTPEWKMLVLKPELNSSE